MTSGFLVAGMICFSQKKTRWSQFMMRGRIAAQGVTLAALVTGVLMAGKKR